MNSVWGRISAAAILSLSVFSATRYFAEKYRPQLIEETKQKPVAFIKELSDEVEKRSASSLVWKNVSQGEALHPDEAVKTSIQGEVRIQFAEGSRFIDLDPESLIVLHQESENEIALDLLGGSLFVGQSEQSPGATPEPALTLKSAQGKIDLSQVTAQLSKSANKDVDVQVIKGKAKFINNGTVQEIGKDQQLSSLEILSPRLDQPSYQNAADPQPIVFHWKGFPEKTWTSLWIGKTRKSMKEISKTDSPDQAELKAQLASGSYFWKLSAKESASGKIVQESPLYRLKVENRFAPSLGQPLHQARLKESRVEFKWLRPETAQKVSVILAKDSALKEVVATKSFTDQESFTEELSSGNYFWQLTAHYKDIQINSPVHSFTVGSEPEAEKVKIPVLISWSGTDTQNPQYFISTPKANLAWTTEQKDQVQLWRLKMAETEAALKDDKQPPLFQTELKENQLEAPLPKPGRYLAMVEALDANKQVLASSSLKSIEVAPLPLLQAPEFEPRAGDFTTDSLGRLNLKWSEIKGAKEYWLILMDSSGTEIRKARFQRNSTALSNLLPGQYSIAVFAVDEHGRESEKSAPRKVKVPDKSSVLPPKFKKIQVN